MIENGRCISGKQTPSEVVSPNQALAFLGKEGAIRMRKKDCKRLGLALVLAIGIVCTSGSRPAGASPQTDVQVPSSPLTFGVFVARFDASRTFTLEGDRWPSMKGNWKSKGDEIELSMS